MGRDSDRAQGRYPHFWHADRGISRAASVVDTLSDEPSTSHPQGAHKRVQELDAFQDLQGEPLRASVRTVAVSKSPGERVIVGEIDDLGV